MKLYTTQYLQCKYILKEFPETKQVLSYYLAGYEVLATFFAKNCFNQRQVKYQPYREFYEYQLFAAICDFSNKYCKLSFHC